MSTKISVTPLIGANLDNTNISTLINRNAGIAASARLGDEIFGSDGRLYVYAEANGAISASTAVCTINAGTFLATSSGGAYTSPATALIVGDRAWFNKASV